MHFTSLPRALALLLAAFPALAQSADLRITAQTLSKSTTAAVFGRLPRAVQAAAVQACNQGSAAVTVPQARVVQQIKGSQGITLLPQSAAIAVVAGKQGSSAWATASRYSTAGLSVISDLTALRVINPGLAVGAVVVTAATILGVGIRDFSPAAATHQYLTLASAMLPDPLQLPPLGCATGYALIEGDPTAKTFDFGMTLPVAAGASPADKE